MTETKHTLGPWEYTDGICIMGGKPPKKALHEWRATICEVRRMDMVTGLMSGSEAEANARLIAAAPELYNAVRALLKLHEAHHNEPLHAQAREILAKAEGRQ